METTIMGYIGTAKRIHSFIPSYQLTKGKLEGKGTHEKEKSMQ